MKAQSFNRYWPTQSPPQNPKGGAAKGGKHHSRGYLAVSGSADRNG